MKDRLVPLVGAVSLALGAVGLLLATMSANAATLAAFSVMWTDTFSSASLDSRWSWLREDPTHWSLAARPGFLRITTQNAGFFGAGGDSKNILVHTAPAGNFELQTRVFFTPTENLQMAGLVVYQDDDNWLVLSRAYCSYPSAPCVGNGIYFDHEGQGTTIGSNFGTTIAAMGEAYLRIVRHSTVYTGYVSLDGANWTTVGTHAVVSGLVPSKIGLVAHDSRQGAVEIPADFDFFTLIDSSQWVFLPLMLK